MIPLPLEIVALVAELSGLNARALFGAYSRSVKSFTDAAVRKQRENEAANTHYIVSNGLHRLALSYLYPRRELRQAGLCRYRFLLDEGVHETGVVGRPRELYLREEFPTPASSAVAHGQYDVADSARTLLNRLDQDRAVDFLTSLTIRGLHVWDSQLYRLRDYSLNDRPWKWDFSLDNYLAWRLTCGSLGDELFKALMRVRYDLTALVTNTPGLLPQRAMLLPTVETLASPGARLCAGGVAVLTAFYRRRENDCLIPLRRRTSSVGTGANMLGVIPQGFHQPTCSVKAEAPLAQTVFRELFEELFGGHELEKGSAHLTHDWFFQESDPMRWFTDHQRYRLICTGVGFNTNGATYDINFLLLIEDDDFWLQYGSKAITNWEFQTILDQEPSAYVSSQDVIGLKRLLLSPSWAGSSLFCFVRGLQILHKVRPDLTTPLNLHDEAV